MPNAETEIQKQMEQLDSGQVAPGPKAAHVEKATDLDRVAGLDETPDPPGKPGTPASRAPERDERGMI